MNVLRSMLMGSVRMYSPDDPPAAGGEVDPPEPKIDPDKEPADTGGEDDPPEPKDGDKTLEAKDGDKEPKDDKAPDGWKDKELKRKHRQLQDEKRRSQDLQQQLDDAQALLARAAAPSDPKAGDPPAAPPKAPAAPAVDVVPRSQVRTEAEKIIAENDFNKACNEVEKAGKTAYKEEWDKIADVLTTLGGFTQEEMVGVLATDDPAKVLYELGKNPDKYHEIKELPPAKRLAAMVKIAMPAPKPVVKPSDAPEPIEPVGGRAGGAAMEELDDKLSDDDWHRKRDAQRLKRLAAKQGNSLRA